MLNNRPLTLIEAARAGDLNRVQELLANKKTDINQEEKDGTTALIAAADNNQVNMVNALLIWGEDINKVNLSQYSALTIASIKGHVEIVYRLLVNGADMDVTGLTLAIEAGHVNVVRMLLALGRNLNLNSELHGFAPLEYVAMSNNLEMARVLLRYRENISNVTVRNAIHGAILHNHVDMVLLLASNEVDAALLVTARKGKEEIVRALLANHAKIDFTDGGGYTALMLASEFGNLNVVNLLLAHPEAANTINQISSGRSALMIASKKNQFNVLRALLAAGANVNVQDYGGFTALMQAAKKGYVDIVRELLFWNAGTGKEYQNTSSQTALDLAVHDEYLVSLMEEHIKERENYDTLKKEMESFFSGKIKLSETKSTFFLNNSLVKIIGGYASPTVEVKPSEKRTP